jgi:hypothetical protein
MTRSTLAWLSAALALGSNTFVFAQSCPPDPKPLTHAPIPGSDAFTVALGQFEGSVALATPQGQVATKVTMLANGGGIFGGAALTIPTTPAVAIYPSTGFDPRRGTIEMWLRPSPTPGRSTLFSLRGAGSIDVGEGQDLVFGETTQSSAPAYSAIYFQNAGGQSGGAAAFLTFIPRGIAVGDFDGDGIADLAIANNAASTLPLPKTPLVPGEVHVFFGPFAPGMVYPTPDRVIEVDRAQGLVVADFDGDGDLDLMAGSYDPDSEPLYGWSNDGAGNFDRMMIELGLGSASGGSMGSVITSVAPRASRIPLRRQPSAHRSVTSTATAGSTRSSRSRSTAPARSRSTATRTVDRSSRRRPRRSRRSGRSP